ncbi:MAG: hypothetical protein WC459_03810 [Patescibacteria group bacterium]
MNCFKKTVLVIILVCFTSISIFIALPKPARAFPVEDLLLEGHFITDSIKKNIGVMIMEASSLALVNAVTYFFQKMAADAATYIVTAAAGQKPAFSNKSWGEYFEDLALNTAMVAITKISDKTLGETLGFSVCSPNINVLGKIKLGMLNKVGSVPIDEPDCSWKTMMDNWDQFIDKFETGEVLKNVGIAFEPGKSDLGLALELNGRVLVGVDATVKLAETEKSKNGVWENIKDITSGKITTPAQVIEKDFDLYYREVPVKQQEASLDIFTGAIMSGGKQILPTVLSTFATTLLNKGIDQLTSKVFSLGDLLGDEDKDISNNFPSSASLVVGRRKAEQVFNDFLRPKILTSSNYDPLVEFSTCPDEDEKQINNCVVDDAFAAAIRQASQGKPLSIKEALDEGYLDGQKPLISSKDARNEQSDCYQKGYCYSNLVKLRTARILPVGFELATDLEGTKGNVTLQDVINGFYDCNEDGGRDTVHPYCHMIDPNWILKLPKTQCQAKIYGPTLVSSASNFRSEVCADPISCISEDENGNCVGGWGYCTKEKNVWKISADKCSEQFNTCFSYKTRDSKVYNYLKNTVDFGSCSAQNIGCRVYSLNGLDATGEKIYFNKNAEKCEAKDAGCTELYSKTNGLAYNLIPNPSFESVTGAKDIAGWIEGVNLTVNKDPSGAFDGNNSVNPAGNLLMDSAGLIKLELNTAYVVSGYFKGSGSSGTTKYRLAVSFYTNPSGASGYSFDPANLISTCKISTDKMAEVGGEILPDSYKRVSCAFLTPNQNLYAKILVGGNSWVDAVQLEEGFAPTSFLSSGYGEVDSVNIKIAPNYLDCQAGNSNPDCSGYAPTCKPEEVGCQNYNSTDGSSVSGVINVNDVCPASCAGYETYKQEATLFENQDFPKYFIPSTAKECPAQEVGCDEFTNLENESKEYFSFVRQCIKPNAAEDAVFYTWEGSDTSGYQLKSHKLKIVPGSAPSPIPDYVINANPLGCTKIIFQKKFGDPDYNPDCREFYNANGAVSYRLLSKTIISTDECAEYRKTDSNEPNCNSTGGVWDSNGQYCRYKGYKAESISCSAASNGCRAYSGAAAGNMRIVLQDDFEGSSANGWNGGQVSAESLSAGGHSLKYPSAASPKPANITRDLSGLVSSNGTYMLSFWAKGPAGGKLNINFVNTGLKTVDLRTDWRAYEVGPFNLNVVGAGPVLQISLSGATGFYIDNITLKEAEQKLYLVKNTWITPDECDRTLGGVFLPQAMLGCKAFTNNDKEAVYFKSFSALCRPEAVGCSAFVNTFNSNSDKNEVYNAICALGGEAKSASEDCKYNNEVVCSVGFGLSFCRFKITDGAMPERIYNDGVSAGIYRDVSTIEVPADKSIYVVNDKKYYCQSKDLGCSVLGQGDLYASPASSLTYIKNKPENYSDTLCGAEAEGCESWTSNKGADYFKVPVKTCEYRDGSANMTGGWFKTGTETSCYSGLIQNGSYGIWRNADTDYDGIVGTCPQNQNACTEFVDPLDTSAKNKTGKPYYLLDNNKLQELSGDETCGGKASLEEGCVLFNKTSDTALKWNAGVTYAKASQEKKIVAPLSDYKVCLPKFVCSPLAGENCWTYLASVRDIYCNGDDDCSDYSFEGAGFYCGKPKDIELNSNIILKVTRDRECGEWLSCKSSYIATDPITQKAKSVCIELGLCDKYQTGSGSSCANFVVNNQDSGKLLTADYYGSRKVGWNSRDYSGFSLGNKYPVTDATVKDVDSTDSKDLRLCVGNCDRPTGAKFLAKEDQNLDGTKLTAATGEKSSCRGYAEQDAPYSYSIGTWDINKQLQEIPINGFQNANICEYGQDCECDYTKLTYGSKAAVKYVDYGNRSVSIGVCQGGSRDGQPCKPGVSYDEDAKNSCGKPEEGGTCLKLQRQDDVMGWNGYCLERDLSTPINGDKNQKACLTWLPQDIVPGQRDIYNQFRTAGYIPPIGGGKYYCLQASGNWNKFSDVSGGGYDYPLLNPWPMNQDICTFVQTCKEPLKTCYPPLSTLPECNFTSYSNTVYRRTNNFTGQSEYHYKSQQDLIKGMSYLGFAGKAQGSQDAAGLTEDNLEEYNHSDGNTYFSIKGSPVYKYELDLIKIKVVATSLTDTIPVGSVFYIRPDKKKISYTAGFGLCGDGTSDSCSGEKEGGIGLKGTSQAISSSEGDVWYFNFDDRQDTKMDFLNTDYTEVSDYCPKEANNNQSGFQVKFVFDKTTGKLLKYYAMFCDMNSNNAHPWIVLQLSARKREVCETVVDTAAFKNHAYTNVLWANNPDNIKGTLKAPAGIPYNYNYEMQPFGSASSDISPAGQGAWYSYYSVGTPNFAGVPWACIGACGTPGESNDNSGDIEFDPSKKNDAISEKTSAGNTFKPREYLGHLFAKIFSVFSLNSNSRTYEENRCSSNSTSEACFKSPSATEIVKYPKIFSFDPAKKLSNGQYKLAEENKFLINNQSNGEISIRGNQYQAVMRFYFWADTDHMPVKSIKVVWGDGSTTETTDGLYKNHKPICAKNNNEKSDVCSRNRNIVCNTESSCPINTYIKLSSSGGPDSGTIVSRASESQVCNAKEVTFGNSFEACDESYFELRHIYMCNTGSCTYSPKVYIVDNWGIDNTFDGDLIRNGPEYDLKNKAGFLGAATGPLITIVP